jgi:hypothetical protein
LSVQRGSEVALLLVIWDRFNGSGIVLTNNKEIDAMKEPGLDGRHRDKDGDIQQKRSDTLNKNLSKLILQFS